MGGKTKAAYKEKLYFGRPVCFYEKEMDLYLMRRIQEEFPNCELISPHLKVHQEGYQRYKLEKGDGMLYFFEEVLPKMDSGIFMPFGDGKFGAGVFREAKFLLDRTKPIWEINLNGLIRVLDLRTAEALSVEETRERVYGQLR